MIEYCDFVTFPLLRNLRTQQLMQRQQDIRLFDYLVFVIFFLLLRKIQNREYFKKQLTLIFSCIFSSLMYGMFVFPEHECNLNY